MVDSNNFERLNLPWESDYVQSQGESLKISSTPTAALNQLAWIAALEWGGDRLRINSLHPNAVFDTGILLAQIPSIDGGNERVI